MGRNAASSTRARGASTATTGATTVTVWVIRGRTAPHGWPRSAALSPEVDEAAGVELDVEVEVAIVEPAAGEVGAVARVSTTRCPAMGGANIKRPLLCHRAAAVGSPVSCVVAPRGV